ncbi:MAG: DUF4292 domain-containing protein [Thermaurantimonas sp.]
MKHTLRLSVFIILAVACKSKKNLSTPSAPIAERTIAESILTRITSQPYVYLKGKGQFQNTSSSQHFRYEIRIQNEERILVDVSDPVLGMRVARLYADRDTILLINRIQKQYAAGGRAELQSLLGIDVETDDLIRLLKALPVRWNASWISEQSEPDMIHLYSIIPLNAVDQVSGELYITGFDFKIRKQILSNIPYKLTAEYEYPDDISPHAAPKNILINLTDDNTFVRLQLKNEKIQSDAFEISIPEVPNGYASAPF